MEKPGILRRFWRFAVGSLAILGAMVLVSTILSVAAIRHAVDKKESLPSNILLKVDLNQGLTDGPPPEGLASFGKRNKTNLRDLIIAIEAGAKDPRVKGLSVRLGSSGAGMSQAQEILAALEIFTKSGKPSFAFAESLGEGRNGTIETLLASGFSEIWLQPSGEVAVSGFAIESPFIRGALEKLDIKPSVARRHEYKGAMENFTEKGMSKELRETLDGVIGDWFNQAVEGIAKNRKLKPEDVKAAIDKAPLSATEALSAKLVDKLGYGDESKANAKEKTKEAKPVSISDYADDARSKKSGKHIAVIDGHGAVVSGKGKSSPLGGGGKALGADTIATALFEAAEDKDISAIVLRIDSPGGSYVASDTVWRAVKAAREKGKPVIASLGGMAASGGYFIAMAADHIVASPGSITGSIGVFVGKPVLDQFWANFGVKWEDVNRGANSGFWSSNHDFTPAQKVRLDAMLDRIYADFTGKAAEARKFTPAEIDAVARGRVFTGNKALEVKLIDSLGGFSAAVEEAKKMAKIAPEETVRLVSFPPPKTPIESIFEMLESGDLPEGIEDSMEIFSALAPIARFFNQPTSGAVLKAPDFSSTR
jgi:protease-4